MPTSFASVSRHAPRSRLRVRPLFFVVYCSGRSTAASIGSRLRLLHEASSIRFLLADDAGAGKTIMAGLLIKELKIRGLVKRVLIITPANLTFQWQRELKDKFRENFEVIRSDVLRANYGMNPWQEKSGTIKDSTIDLSLQGKP